MLEIYNEVILDLLNPTAVNLAVREDAARGCYVEGLSEQVVLGVEDVADLLSTGLHNRHVGETRLNKQSSRSHSVFTCVVERHSRSQTGASSVLYATMNLIDLAGSERVYTGAGSSSVATKAQGRHLVETCKINKSLTALGRVINELVEGQKRAGGARHIPYRDSKLTFLLQDSLGGNAKTFIVANVSPSSVNVQETLSTLFFVRNAKNIRNKPNINLEARAPRRRLFWPLLGSRQPRFDALSLLALCFDRRPLG